jgi:hypothetical protein
MPRVPIGRRAMTVALSSMILMAATLVPLGGLASAVQTSTNCPSGEGTQCFLVISTPSSVQTGVTFTVRVLVTTDGTTIAKSDPCGSNALVTLTVTPSDPTFTATAKKGVATFNISLPDSGTWRLHATAHNSASGCESTFFSPDTKFVNAVPLQPGEPIAPCPPDTNCVQVTSGTGSQATLIADTGSSWDTADFIAAIPGGNCSSGGPLDPGNGVLDFILSGTTTTKTIVLALDSQLVNQGIGQFNVCWSSLTPFVPKGGGALVTTGNLPDCKSGTLPCVASKTSGPHNVAFITVKADPNDPIDPRLYGH